MPETLPLNERIVVLDARGNDGGAEAVMEGVVRASHEDIPVVVAGALEELQQHIFDVAGFSFNVEDVCGDMKNIDGPDEARAMRSRILRRMEKGRVGILPAGNILRGAKLVRSRVFHSIVSMGSTKDAAGAAIGVGMVPGFRKGAIAIQLPVRGGGRRMFLDVGGFGQTPTDHARLAIIGSELHRLATGTPDPLVATLGIGEEPHKAIDMHVRTVLEMCHRAGVINFSMDKNAQGGDPVKKSAPFNVIVAESKVGNLMLKLGEAFVGEQRDSSRELVEKRSWYWRWLAKAGAFALRGVRNEAREHYGQLDPDVQGAEPMYGVQYPVLVGHGSAGAQPTLAALRKGRQIDLTEFNANIAERASHLPPDILDYSFDKK